MIDRKDLLDIIECEIIKQEYPKRAQALYIPVEYTLESAGKRLRPLLCLMACEALGGKAANAVNQAVAIEMFHNFTLIHDDVMDGSDKRRGRPTVMARWGTNQAILSGDALLTLSVMKATQCPDFLIGRVLDLFNRTALEVYEGQQMDMEFEGRDDVTTDEYIEMIKLKTSVLLGSACATGALMAGNSSQTAIDAFYLFGERLGIAFQLRDDWLDTFGESSEFGKPIGRDIINRKKTWLYITALNEASDLMAEAVASDSVVAKVTEVYRTLNLSERCDLMIERYCDEAIAALDSADIDEDWRAEFTTLARQLCLRTK